MSIHTMVVGGGALGSILAAHLGRSGERVTLVARGKRADHLERNGVTITGLEELKVPVTIARTPSDVRNVDLLILATKTYDTASALAGIRLSRPPLAFSVQNGVQRTSTSPISSAQTTCLGLRLPLVPKSVPTR